MYSKLVQQVAAVAEVFATAQSKQSNRNSRLVMNHIDSLIQKSYVESVFENERARGGSFSRFLSDII